MAGIDGDIKALIRMREHKRQQTDSAVDPEEDFDEAPSAHTGDTDWQVLRDAVARYTKTRLASAKKTRTAVQAFQDSIINYAQISVEAFKAIEDSDLDKLNTIFMDVEMKKGDLSEVYKRGKDETLLIKLVDSDQIDSTILDRILKLGNEFICAAMKIVVEGKKTSKTALHICSERGHLSALRKILSAIKNEDMRINLLNTTTIILPEGQRPRPLTCLHIAAKNGHNDIVRYFVEDCKMNVNLTNQKGDTPILWAANDNHPDTVSLLISLGSNLNDKNDKGSSALHWACRNGHTEVVRVLLDEGAGRKIDVNIERALGLVRPVIAASAMGFHEIVKMLVDHGADIHKPIHDGQTALSYAAAEGYSKVIVILIDAGADINYKDDSGNTPLLHAAMHGHSAVVNFLTQCGADLSHKNYSNQTVWDFALQGKSSRILKAMVQHTMKQNSMNANPDASITRQFPVGVTPLHSAAALGDIEKLQFLLDMSIDPLSRNEEQRTFLHIATIKNQLDIIKKFAAKKLCALKDDEGNTCLHLACEFGFNEAIAVLLPLSDVSIKNDMIQTPLHLAAKTSSVSPALVESIITEMKLHHEWTVLHSKDVLNRNALHMAAMGRNIEIIPALNDININQNTTKGYSPLHTAVFQGDLVLLDALLLYFAKTIDLDHQTDSGQTSLHLAVDFHQPRMIEKLIISGADLTKKSNTGRTVLHELAYKISQNDQYTQDSMTVFEVLISNCVYWMARSKGQPVPTRQADEYSELYVEALRFLFESCCDDDGYTVRQYASSVGASDLLISMLNLSRLYKFELTDSKDDLEYDVTGLTPNTLLHKPTRTANEVTPADSIRDHYSLAELIIDCPTAESAAAVFNTSPMSNLVDSYWSTYQILFGLLFLVHVIHMSCYSYFGIIMLNTSLETAVCGGVINNSTGNKSCELCDPPIGVEVLLLLEPIVVLVYFAAKFFGYIRQIARVGCSTFINNIKKGSAVMVISDIYIQLCGFLMALCTLVWFIMYRYCYFHQDYLLAISYILGWIYSINFTRGFKYVHNFSIMLQNMLFRDVLRFAVIYLFILFAFAFAYHALIQAIPTLRDETPRYEDTLFLVFNWMIGMADYNADPAEFQALNKSSVMISAVYSVYVILSTIVLLNLLIAMMSDSYADIKSQSEVSWTISSIRLAIELEQTFPFLPKMFSCLRKNRKRLRFDEDDSRWKLLVPISEVKNRTLNQSNALSALNNRIHSLEMNIQGILEQHENQILQALGHKTD